jgi:endonuclease-3
MVATADAKRHAAQVVRGLKKLYPEAECALQFRSPLELLIATILSAQCTDQRVNLVTPALFAAYPTAADYAAAPRADIERAIQSTGFFRNKAKSIQTCCQQLVERHGGQVPQTLEELVVLPGVGRKTANVVLGTAFGIAEGIVVDTHVQRLSRRLGLTEETDPEKIERDLTPVIPREDWTRFGPLMQEHGRTICKARKPECGICPVAELCPSAEV